MTQSNAIDWVPLDAGAGEPVQVGDLVSSDAGGMPIYRVTALGDGCAFLAGERQARPLTGFRWKASAGAHA